MGPSGPATGPRGLRATGRRGSTTRWLVRFGYVGTGFSGWARQPGLRTVEGEILDGLRRRRLSTSPPPLALPVASRTDRGVSARANALAVESPLEAPALLRALNGLAPDIFFSAAHPIDASFSPRRANHRWYRYLEPRDLHDPDLWRRLLAAFVGTVDVRSFGRALPTRVPLHRTVTRASVSVDGPWMGIDLVAPSFVWGMVRKIIAGVAAVEKGDIPESTLRDAIEGRRRLMLPLADPEPLILWEVGYPFEFEHTVSRYSPHQSRFFAHERTAAEVRRAVLGQLDPTPAD